MKTRKNKMKSATTFVALSSMLLYSCSLNSENGLGTQQQALNNSILVTPTVSKKKIKIALLLDTSNSMDGLINQAKSQLWKIVNELAAAKCDNEKPSLEIALYEYGNDALTATEGYIRQVSMFTNDLDLISEKLFSLTTNGGSEFCGHVIQTSLNQLNWSDDGDGLKLIFIAGNEPFTQGNVSYEVACGMAKGKNVVINSIYCGSFQEGASSGWKNGATLTGGEYMSIEQDRKTVYIETPYDDAIGKLNEKLNNTYISYGSSGRAKKENQIKQDSNAATYGGANTADRAASKASAVYQNESWDLVDASKTKNFDINKVAEAELPSELKSKTKEEKERYIKQKDQEREKIKTEILELNKKRTQYIVEKEKTIDNSLSLDAVMIKAIKEQAKNKNFVFEGK